MYQLRPYQRAAVSATVKHFRQSDAPAVLVLPTGAGKSLVIAELGKLARGRVLILAHVKELVEQNHAKYRSFDLEAGIFAAGLGRKEATQKIVFGSVQSVARNMPRFDDSFSLLVIDECHRIPDDSDGQYHQVIAALRKHNPSLKILGLTATPYRLDSGWIYQYHHQGRVRTERPRLFRDCIYELPLRQLVDEGYLTPARLVDAPIAHYDFSQLIPRSNGLFSEADLNRTLGKQRRATPGIINHIVDEAKRRHGVMIFAATVRHAEEIMGYLPAGQAALITGNTTSRARDNLIRRFKAKELKYLVNVSVLTTGFDAPHVDLIAVLRPTESVSLYQQIVGRGLRLAPGKTECLVLDYAGNCFSLYEPMIGDPKPNPNSEVVEVPCPVCGCQNQFWGKTDDDGSMIEHYGRRCQGIVEQDGARRQCDFRYKFKTCDQCGAENDIAARICQQCQATLVDPDKKLRELLQLKDAWVLRCSEMHLSAETDPQGRDRLRVQYVDANGNQLSERFVLHTPAHWGAFHHHFCRKHLRERHRKPRFADSQAIVDAQQAFRRPDFVIARRDGRFWRLREKIFDYELQRTQRSRQE